MYKIYSKNDITNKAIKDKKQMAEKSSNIWEVQTSQERSYWPVKKVKFPWEICLYNGLMVMDDKRIANELNRHFCSVFTLETEPIPDAVFHTKCHNKQYQHNWSLNTKFSERV